MKELEKDPWEGLAQRIPPGTRLHEAGRASRRVRPLHRDRAGHRRPRPRLPAPPRHRPQGPVRRGRPGGLRLGARGRRGAPPALPLPPRGLDVRPLGGARREDARGLGRRRPGRERRRRSASSSGSRSASPASSRTPRRASRTGPRPRSSSRPGQKVEVKVIGLDAQRRRISLSAKGAGEEAERGEIRKYREESAQAREERAGPPDELRRLAHGGAHHAEQGGEVGPLRRTARGGRGSP